VSDDQPNLDELDHRIIDALRENGRVSNQDLARQLDVTAATIRTRIRRLEESSLLRIVAITDFAVDYDFLLSIGVQVQERAAEDVARELAELPEVFSCNLVTGDHEIEILVAAQDHEALAQLLTNKLSNIEGIRTLNPSLAIDVLKYDSQTVPLTW